MFKGKLIYNLNSLNLATTIITLCHDCICVTLNKAHIDCTLLLGAIHC